MSVDPPTTGSASPTDRTTARVGRRAGTLPSLALALADPAVREIVVEPGEYV